MRSRTGCLTCRQRKLKCDEKKPVCGQCIKASRECIPSSGIVFRHQHNASMNGEDSGDENSLKGFYSYKNTFEEDAIWLDIPRNVTFINTTNPYLDPVTPDLETMSVTSMDSPAPFQPRSINQWPISSSVHSLTSTPSSMGPDLAPTSVPLCYTPELDALPSLIQSPPTSTVNTPISPPASLYDRRIHPIMDRSGAMTPPPIDPRLKSPFDSSAEYMPRQCSMSGSQRSPPRSDGESLLSKDHEVTFLLRYFSEGPGHWMDLFDRDTYFTSYVPVQARENALLKNAAVACAAKAFAHVQSHKAGGPRSQARVDVYSTSSVDWKHKAAVYYDNAVSLLLQALKSDTTITPDDSDCEFPQQNGEILHPTKRRRTSSNASCKSSTDELLAASAILCVYEFLDTSMSEWAKHLCGAKSLLLHSQERMMPFQLPSPNSPLSASSLNFISKARRSTFWNIARQDMFAAYINKTHTHLDTEDHSLWKEAGLLIDDQGFLILNIVESGYSDDGAISNALTWLMSKLINFMAAGDKLPTDTGMGWDGIPQSTLLNYWYHLRNQFQDWYDSLPMTFKPSNRVEPTLAPGRLLRGENEALFPEVWYNIPMCASTMQTYHMSQILLLMNKPHESTQDRSTVFARLNSYQSVLAACQKHSREIVGISLAQSDDAVRIFSVQALFTAGQCLGDGRERQVVLDLLRDIETELGYSTEYRARQLTEQWQWEAHQDVFVP